MRTTILAATLALAASPAFAQTPPAAPAAPPPATSPAPAGAGAGAAPAAPQASAASRTGPQTAGRPQYRQTLEERFAEANTSKDGKLTRDQAEKARWTYIARNFDTIDKSHQGYVTVDSIRAYAKERRAARQAAQQPAHS